MIVGLTGPRPKSLGMGDFDPGSLFWRQVAMHLGASFARDVTGIISGGALGFDMVGAKVAVDRGISLELALPFDGYDSKWGPDDKTRLRWLVNRATKTTYVSEPGYTPWKYQVRNEYIVDNCDYLIALWNGMPGGTANCVRYAGTRVPMSIVKPERFM